MKELKIVNLILCILASLCASWIVGFPLVITMVGGFLELIFTSDANDFGPLFIACVVGCVLVTATFVFEIVAMFSKKKSSYIAMYITSIVFNLISSIFFTVKLASYFGQDMGEGDELYGNFVLLYGPMIFGVGFCIAALVITLVIAGKRDNVYRG